MRPGRETFFGCRDLVVRPNAPLVRGGGGALRRVAAAGHVGAAQGGAVAGGLGAADTAAVGGAVLGAAAGHLGAPADGALSAAAVLDAVRGGRLGRLGAPVRLAPPPPAVRGAPLEGAHSDFLGSPTESPTNLVGEGSPSAHNRFSPKHGGQHTRD